MICAEFSVSAEDSGEVTTRRRRASSSDGDTWSSTISSTIHAEETAAIPPSVSTIMSGTSNPAVLSACAVLRASMSLRRASIITTSWCAVSKRFAEVARGYRSTRWLSTLRAAISDCSPEASLSSVMRYMGPPGFYLVEHHFTRRGVSPLYECCARYPVRPVKRRACSAAVRAKGLVELPEIT